MAAETNGDKRATLPGGVYRHPDTGEELVTQPTAKFGNPQADAIVRLGFVYVGPAKLEQPDNNGPAGKVVAGLDPGAGPIANTSPSQKSVAELETELALARGRERLADKAQAGKSNLVDQSAVEVPTAKKEDK